jgi:hypothetical protein
MKGQRGELTTQQIVGLIVLIVSFSIILILIFRLNLGETTNKEICHNSVLLKSKSLVGGALDCRTNYVCLSGGRKCEGINPTETIEIDLNQESDEIKDDIMKAIADEMADCWWMFGEGKIDYVGGVNIIGNKVCALCSKISFDEIIKNKEELKEGITYEIFYEFLNNELKDKTQTYLQYFGIKKIEDSYFDNNFDFKNNYYVLTGIKKKGVLGFFELPDLPEFGGNLENKDSDKKISEGVVILEKTSEFKCDEFLTKA